MCRLFYLCYLGPFITKKMSNVDRNREFRQKITMDLKFGKLLPKLGALVLLKTANPPSACSAQTASSTVNTDYQQIGNY